MGAMMEEGESTERREGKEEEREGRGREREAKRERVHSTKQQSFKKKVRTRG
jgi:hypothetical protein